MKRLFLTIIYRGDIYMTVTSNIKWKKLAVCIAVPLLVGGLAALISKSGFAKYAEMPKPALSPPAWLFPVVWTILYILMGISSYLVYTNNSSLKKSGLTIYAIQLFINFLWPVFFFNLNAYLFAFVWLILLWSFAVAMTVIFYRINKTAGLLQIPYIVWLTFAAYLNLAVYLM